MLPSHESGFGTIRNNTALKQRLLLTHRHTCFGTIRNNTALKHAVIDTLENTRFGTIRNNTALKLPNAHSKSDNSVLEPFETTQL